MIKINYNGDNNLNFEEFVFSGGECSIKIKDSPKFFAYLLSCADPIVSILAQIQNSNDLIKVGLIKNAINELILSKIKVRYNAPKPKYELVMPYIPYARQDRVCAAGESFSLKVFANVLNSFGFDLVRVVDPHSDVAPALINNVQITSQLQVIDSWRGLRERLSGVVFVSPDAGANKKISALAKYYHHDKFIRADKLRDLSNGKIIETIVYADDLNGKDVAIIDDIIDGGRTFIELAKVLRLKNCGKILLYATHGIFSQGVDVLLGSIDEIWTTNSFKDINHPSVKELKIV